MSSNNDFYNNHVSELNARYLTVKSEVIHKSWLDETRIDGYALDIGTGIGRDAAYLCQLGYKVVAIDPSTQMLNQAKQNFPNLDIHWLEDSLPELIQTRKLPHKYNLILLSAVWMHVAPSQRRRSIQKLSNLLAPGGKIVLTLRHGSFNDGRTAHSVSADELKGFALDFGLRFLLRSKGKLESDQLERSDVTWETIELSLPDDGTGAFPLLRNIVINDAKAATYKIALIRSLLRIAEGHPGAALTTKSNNEQVAIPLGLVAMYWLKLFKPLVACNMQQSSNAAKGLGFIKDNGWRKLDKYTNNDFFVGAIHSKDAKFIHSTFGHIAALINNMPAKYITLPGTDKAVFEIEKASPKAPKNSIVLDHNYFVSLGVFYVPRAIWNTLSNFSCWIEPALVNEWVRIMQNFKNNIAKNFTIDQYLQALKWEDATRSTKAVRQRISELKKEQGQNVYCTWSNKKIGKAYDVDHTFPFVRWPNNDLWNLSPTLQSINRQKSDKLASYNAMVNAKPQILNFWKAAWHKEQQFFIQSNMALPELSLNNRSYEDVFDAMLAQRVRIKRLQQLRDWNGPR